MKIDSELALMDLDGQKLPVINFEFLGPEGPEVVADFEAKRVLLHDLVGDHFSMQDGEGHEYCKVKKDARWVEVASTCGFFTLTMKTPLPSGLMGGRILLISFPFGHVLKDSHPFAAAAEEVDQMQQNEKVVARLKKSAVKVMQTLTKNQGTAN